MRKRLAVLLPCLLGLSVLVGAGLQHFFPDMPVNNRFVSYALIVFVDLTLLCAFCIQPKVYRNLAVAVTGMGAFAFALVPLYNVFCDVTGLNGKVDLSVTAATPEGIDTSREVTVEFVVNHNLEMPWQFKPKHFSLKVHPGEVASTAYFARNPTKKTMVAQAIPSISPSRVSKHFKKLECFCFASQTLGPGQADHMTLRFYLDPSFPKDVQRLTLSYTLFDITKLDDVIEHSHHSM